MFLDGLARIQDATSFAFSAENPTGAKGGGSKGKPWEKLSPARIVAPGETLVLADTDGPGVIQSMWFGGDVGWNFILRVYWDGQANPSIESPLGAFFGYGFTETVKDSAGNFPTLNSAVVLAAPCRGLNCYWPMPFRQHVKITLENRSPSENRATFYMITGKKTALPEDAGFFHASYRQERPVSPERGYTVIDGIRGKGHFAGVALFAGVNGSNGCWVEGEMKMYIDGDIHPSINYTGTEDYFCGSYAFGYDSDVAKYQPYSGHYAGMYAFLGGPEPRYNYQPRFMLYRWHIPDPIHFSTDFRMLLQNMHFTPHGHRPRRDDYSSVAYWYQTHPASALHPLPSDDELDMR
ncbi:MAG: DUF2961 domain-containing protein [Planctomycetota bacterium]|nr:DUF2961 domain-containing protein [Planctomycetota bacterium]